MNVTLSQEVSANDVFEELSTYDVSDLIKDTFDPTDATSIIEQLSDYVEKDEDREPTVESIISTMQEELTQHGIERVIAHFETKQEVDWTMLKNDEIEGQLRIPVDVLATHIQTLNNNSSKIEHLIMKLLPSMDESSKAFVLWELLGGKK